MKTATLALAMAAVATSSAHAALLVDDNFDSYENQAAFEAVWAPIGTTAPISGQLSAAQTSSGPQSVAIAGTNATGQYQNRLTFPATPLLGIGDQLVWSFDFYDSTPGAFPRPHYASLQTSAAPGASPAGQTISLGTNDNQNSNWDDGDGNRYLARISGYSHAAMDPDGGPEEAPTGTGPGAFFKLNDTSAGGRGTNSAWHRLMLILTTLNGTTVNHAYYVDGDRAETVSNVGPNLSYSVIQIGSGMPNGLRIAYFDNMKLEFVPVAVPEASSMQAVGLVGLLSMVVVWLRRRVVAGAA